MKFNIEITIAGLKLPYGLSIEAHSKDEAYEKAKLLYIPTFKINENRQSGAFETPRKKMEEKGDWQ